MPPLPILPGSSVGGGCRAVLFAAVPALLHSSSSPSTGRCPGSGPGSGCCWPPASTSTPAGTTGWPAHLRPDAARLLHRPRHGSDLARPACAQGSCSSPASVVNLGLLVLLQVRQLLPRNRSRRRCHACGGASASLPVLQGDPADRHLVLHLRGDQLHGRRLPRPHPGRAQPGRTSCCSSCSSRTWSPGRSSAPRDFLPQIRPAASAGTGRACSLGVQLFLHGPVQEAGHRRPHGPVRRSGLRRPRRPTAPAPSGWR